MYRDFTAASTGISGGERTRTADFYVANVALCQLSYTPGEIQDIAVDHRSEQACRADATPVRAES